jgi:hypothetical protein
MGPLVGSPHNPSSQTIDQKDFTGRKKNEYGSTTTVIEMTDPDTKPS